MTNKIWQVIFIVTCAVVFLIVPKQTFSAPYFLTTESATTFCDGAIAKIRVTLKNEEPVGNDNVMEATASALTTKLGVNLGTIFPSQTVVATMSSGLVSTRSGTVQFDLAWKNRAGEGVAFASYSAINCTPTAITINSFEPFAKNASKVIVNWATASELKISGFNIWRATKKTNSEAFSNFTKINSQLIAARNPGSMFGNTYRLVDDKVKAGAVYHYKAEAIGTNGKMLEWTEVVKVKVPAN